MQQLTSPAPAGSPVGWLPPPDQGAFERLPLWKNGWRLAVVWLLGVGMWVAVGSIATEGWVRDEEVVVALVFLDLFLGHLAVAAVAFRRRWPVGVAVLTSALCLGSMMAAVPSLLALISLATRRHLPSIVGVAVFGLAVDVFYELVVVPLLGIQGEVTVDGSIWASGLGASLVNLGFVVLIYLVCILVGWNIGSRRELVGSWRSQAETANREQAARVAQAQLAERARIAREMHDVLAHRLSLVAMHAGVLAHRTDLPEEQRREAAEVVRAGAHQALEELREVLGVLRADVDGEGGEERQPGQAPGQGLGERAVEAPQPGLSGIPSLVAEVTSSGQEVHLRADPQLWARSVSLPASTGRHAYRVVQEALTNARKHASGAAATVDVGGRPGEGLTIVVANPVAPVAEGTLPSGGRGLTGMAERVQLAGGRFEAGVEVTHFVVRVWLPWTRKGKA